MAFKKTILLRTRLAFLATLLFAMAIVLKLVHIQFLQGARWRKAAKTIGLECRSISATRGNICAEDGSLLATSLPFYRVALDPCIAAEDTFRQHIPALSQHLAKFYQDKSAEAYQQLIQAARQAQRRYIILNKKRVDYATMKVMRQWPLFCQGRWHGGVIFEKVEQRFKPFRSLAARTIGFVNENEYGAGLEYSFHPALKGTQGKALYQRTVGGNWKMIYNSTAHQPVHGYDIVTTLDINLQDVAHSSLLQALQASQAAYGCAVVMEVQTGEIKALANLTRMKDGRYRERYNYAVGNQGTTEPGSTFKLASMLALFEETKVALTDTVDTGDGQVKFYDRIMKDVQRGGFGIITVQEAFEKSSNTGISQLIYNAFCDCPQQFTDRIKRLGLHVPIGFQLAGEGKPLIKTPKSPDWSGTTLPWMSIGYALKITPLQTLMLYNAVANNGKMVQPILVKEIRQANKTLKTFHSKVLNPKICSKATLQKLQTMLAGVVERGTARRFRHSYYKIAGKSGTANKLVNGRYTNDTYISFAGYFPATAPRYSCIVVIDTPKQYAWHFGGSVAQVVKNIADKIAAKDLSALPLDVAPGNTPQVGTFPLIKAGKRDELWQLCDAMGIPHHPQDDTTAPWIRSVVVDNTLQWQSNGPATFQQVPHVRGMTLRDALFLLENCGLQVIVQGNKAKRVRTQSIRPGTKAVRGNTIVIAL